MIKKCQICSRDNSKVELVPSAVVRPSLGEYIKTKYPKWSPEGYICRDDLKKFRSDYLYQILQDEKGELTNLEKEVIEKLNEYESISSNIEDEFYTKLSFGQKLSDKIASFGGSWKFIIIFFSILLIWMFINTYLLLTKPFDPYPFILLNLVLSCLASIQAPIIMMSQNRQEDRDRKHAEHDYKINLKAEIEIRQLHQKIDHLLTQQWERMVEIQQLQLELIEEVKNIKK